MADKEDREVQIALIQATASIVGDIIRSAPTDAFGKIDSIVGTAMASVFTRYRANNS